MKKTALIILAEGFEEVEAVTPIDILKRAGVDIKIAGLGRLTIKGAHGIRVECDCLLKDYKNFPDALILPGGMPGAENLASSVEVKDLILKMHEKKKLIAAICASPALVLAPLTILKDREATCFPGYEKSLPASVKFVKKDVVQSGNIITSRGAGTAFAFGLKITQNLVGKPIADTVAQQMLYTN
ncbi:MAG: DJ-1/PfpI family protein [Candidatus Omnitrophica bacterium]|nr:DJ-1/PfpI family protein [Candidatus Omnitrophota bacterium]